MAKCLHLNFGIPFALVLLGMVEAVAAAGEVRQAHEDFSTDPGWEAIHNRVIGEGGPTIRQDFGWTAADNGNGAIGGTVWSGLVPATYGMPIGPFDLKRKLTASGKITIKTREPQALHFRAVMKPIRDDLGAHFRMVEVVATPVILYSSILRTQAREIRMSSYENRPFR